MENEHYFFLPFGHLGYSLAFNFCMFQLEKTSPELAKMASIHLVDVDKVPVYVQYFDVTLIPATVFFFNAQHMKVDWGYV